MNNEIKKNKVKKGLNKDTNLVKAEDLLYKSCRSAFNRVRNKNNNAYQGVKIQWNTAKKMKEALLNNNDFWKKWVDLTKTYIDSEKKENLRPTIDRIESNALMGGHYFEKNIRPLTKGENSKLGRAIPNKALLIHNNKPILFIESDSLYNVHSKLKVLTKANIHNLKRNTGQFLNIDNEYSVLLQSSDKKKIESFPGNDVVGKYKAKIYKTLFLVDYYTGKEYALGVKKEKFIFDKFYLQDSEDLL